MSAGGATDGASVRRARGISASPGGGGGGCGHGEVCLHVGAALPVGGVEGAVDRVQ